MADSFTYKKEPYACDCGWSGLGKDLAVGDVFEQLFEINCPSCGDRMGTAMHPTTEECRAHADQLHPLDLIQLELKEAVEAGTMSLEDAEIAMVAAVRERYPGNSWDEVLRDVAADKAARDR